MKSILFGAASPAVRLFVVALLMAGGAGARADDVPAEQPAQAASAPPAVVVQTSVNGFQSLDVREAGPIYIEFENSPLLSAKLAETAKGAGLDVVGSADQARTVVRVAGELSLNGGPRFYRGIKFPLGVVSEKALAEHDGKRSATANEVGGAAMLAISTHLATTTLGAGFGISNLSTIIGDMTGVRGWANTKITGDPRGWCLMKCENWNKVSQVVEVKVTWSVVGNRQTATSTSKAFSETLVPDELVNSAMTPVLALFTSKADGQVALAVKH